MSPSEIIFCNVCGKMLEHHIVAKHDRSRAEGEVEITRSAEILECGGCGYTVLRRKVHFSEFQYYPGDLDPDPQYVPRHNHRQQPVWLQSLEDDNMRDAFFETVEAFNQEMLYLSAVGIRTVLDMVLVSKVGDKGSFKAKLNKLENGGHVTSSEKERLEVLVEAGSAAAHRGHRINIEDLGILLDILEELVQKLYVTPNWDKELAANAKRIGQNVPPRPPRGA